MKIERLVLPRFKNLRDFSIDFDPDEARCVLVGRNGTGKSNLIEALVVIFRDLDLHESPAFPYELRYRCRGRVVEASALGPGPYKQAFTVDGVDVSASEFRRRSELRPAHVFGYYSGPSNRLEDHFTKHQEQFYEALLAGTEDALRPLFYARLVHSQFVLLSFFLRAARDDASAEEFATRFLSEKLRITALDSVLFVFREPHWSGPKRSGTSRFWGAKGTVARLLALLHENSLAPLVATQRFSVGFRRSQTAEHLYMYLPGLDALRRVGMAYPTQRDFFRALESTYISALIAEVRIRVQVRGVDGALTFRELSEGEQQLLMVLGLLRFTAQQESLFLLDEPDTHLNPAWSSEYIDLIKQVMGDDPSSEVLLATHNPLVVAGLKKEQVRIMQRDDGSGRISAVVPDVDPRGLGVAALLTSDLYGLRSSLDNATLEMLDRRRELSARDSELTDAERRDLERLSTDLQGLGFVFASRDPVQEQFQRAMGEYEREQDLLKPVLSGPEVKQRSAKAVALVKKLLKDKPA